MQGIRDYNDEKLFNLPSLSEGYQYKNSKNRIKRNEKKKIQKAKLEFAVCLATI